jgi:cell division protein FtsX
LKKPAVLGIVAAVIGLVLLLLTFWIAYSVLQDYRLATPPNELVLAMNALLYAALQALFLGIMGWVGSLLLLRGVDFFKVEKGVGVVTFKVEKGVGVVTSQEQDETKPA